MPSMPEIHRDRIYALSCTHVHTYVRTHVHGIYQYLTLAPPMTRMHRVLDEAGNR